MVTIPERLRSSLLNALHVAATQFDADAETMKTAGLSRINTNRLIATFLRQAKEARELASWFDEENGSTITVK